MIIVKPIIGYEGLYLIDSMGNIISMPKQNGSRYVNEYNILKQKISKRTGYYEVSLSKNGILKTKLVHRLLAQHFIDNPLGLPEVNHKNGIKTDNRLENLEWCSVSQNTKHAYDNNLGGFKDVVDNNLAKINQTTSYKKIVIINIFTNEEYNCTSSKEAAKYLNTTIDNISRAIRTHQTFGKKYKIYGDK